MESREAKAEAAAARENLRYELKDDITLWLRNNAVTEPMVMPTWPRDRGCVPVFLQWLDGQDPTLGVAANEREMRNFTHPQRLWFHIPRQILFEATSADPAWFS
jgi:hypothetical protein